MLRGTHTSPFIWPHQEVRSVTLTQPEFFYTHAFHAGSLRLLMSVFTLPRGAQPDCSADSFEISLDLIELPMDIFQLRCPKITDIYKVILKDQHFSTAAMFSIFKNFPRCCRWLFYSSVVTTGSQILPFMVIILHIWAGFKHILNWKHMYFRELKVIQGGWIRVLVLCIRSLLVEINRKHNLHWLKQWREFIITPKKARDCSGYG